MSKGRDAGKRDIGKNYVGYRRSRRQMQKRRGAFSRGLHCRLTQGQGYEMKARIRHSLSTVKMLLRFYSVRYYRKVKRFEPILRHRICRLGKESRRKAC